MADISTFSSTLSRLQIIEAAREWIGTPYVHQASAKGAGADCLGLIRGVWRELYGREPEAPPPYTPDWNERSYYGGGGRDVLLEAARRNLVEKRGAKEGAFEPGDVLIFRVAPGGPAKHCGLASAPDRFIHAYAGRAVTESWFNRWWRARLVGVFEFPDTD
ncbi:MAG: NlpC/P60 family protein [Pseudomonadota bacterium]